MNITAIYDFKTDISKHTCPQEIYYPFNYEPHPLAKIAANELVEIIANISQSSKEKSAEDFNGGIGKMFGVLVVRKKDGGLGYLAAFSGKLYDKTNHTGFVPPIFDTLDENGFYKKGEQEINLINAQIKILENREDYIKLKSEFEGFQQEYTQKIERQTLWLKQAKNQRKIKRAAIAGMSDSEKTALLTTLEHESIRQHYELKDLKKNFKKQSQEYSDQVSKMEEDINKLKKLRQKMSASLQQLLFENYTFLNIYGQEKNLLDIFDVTADNTPPSGAGECAAPKLFQYAFLHQLHPVALAEFWYGKSPSTEIRKHRQFYPACTSKCKPILKHMLSGLKVSPNPLLTNPALFKSLPIIFEDDHIVAVNKPPDMLAVPGKDIEDSVYTRIKQHCKQNGVEESKEHNPMIVHRLDMSTSGVMILAKTKEVHRILQSQFIKRTIKKRYVALLDGVWRGKLSGTIDLPMRVDLDNRPRQMVCYEYGKKAITHWEIHEIKNGKTRIHLYPVTGRTHQLRVHASHPEGLNLAIYGDDLYGKRSDRLYLHAERIEFIHPITGKSQVIVAEAAF